jgi:outer membrane lipopolysaccharide assembly protein LptE/RlpB
MMQSDDWPFGYTQACAQALLSISLSQIVELDRCSQMRDETIANYTSYYRATYYDSNTRTVPTTLGDKRMSLRLRLGQEKEKRTWGRFKARPYIVVMALLMLGGCGYHVVGRSSSLPKSVHVIAVPALENKTTSYRIEQKLTAATVHEFLAKTTYKVVSDPANGDAVLRGKIVSVETAPLLFATAPATATSPPLARATAMLITVKCEVTLEERESGKVLYHTDNFVFRNEYEISTDVKSFFEEQDPAVDRLAQDLAGSGSDGKLLKMGD